MGLDVAADWMQLPPPIWLQSALFLRFQEMVHSLKVVNDCAERAVTEFMNYSQDAGRRDRVQMVVNTIASCLTSNTSLSSR